MRFMVKRKPGFSGEVVKVLEETEAPRFEIRANSGFIATVIAGTFLILGVLLHVVSLAGVELLDGLPGIDLAIFVIGVVGSGALTMLGAKAHIQNDKGDVLGYVRRRLFSSKSWIELGGARYGLRVNVTGGSVKLESTEDPELRIAGDFAKQRYEMTRGGKLVARIFNYGLEPERDFLVDVPEGDAVAPIVIAVLVERRVRSAGAFGASVLGMVGWF